MSRKYSLELEARLRVHITESLPLGPFDSTRVTDPEISALLFDRQVEAIQATYDRGAQILIGRRGSGKSAALRAWTRRDSIEVIQPWRMAPSRPAFDYIVELQAYNEFPRVERALEEVRGPGQATPHVEHAADIWEGVFWFHLAREILNRTLDEFARNSAHYKALAAAMGDEMAHAAISDELIRDIIAGKLDQHAVYRARRITAPNWSSIRDMVDAFLTEQGKRAVVTLDSMDEYELNRSIVRVALNGLMRCGAQMGTASQTFKLIFCLPSEVFSRLILPRLSSPMKDMQVERRSGFQLTDNINWSARDLLEMAAFRYRLFLEIYDGTTFEKIAPLNIHDFSDLLEFWRIILPPAIQNRFGGGEVTLNYILRHTQLLPRQVMFILNILAAKSHAVTNSWSNFPGPLVVESIDASANILAREVFSAYQELFPQAFQTCENILRGCTPLVTYGELQRRWSVRGRHTSDGLGQSEFIQFLDMAAEIGVLGRPRPALKSRAGNSEITARFAYETGEAIVFEEGERICIHPLFHSVFQIEENRRNGIVCPDGSRLERLQ